MIYQNVHLGEASERWADLFKASGSVISFKLDDLTITHTVAKAVLPPVSIPVAAAMGAAAAIIKNPVVSRRLWAK